MPERKLHLSFIRLIALTGVVATLFHFSWLPLVVEILFVALYALCFLTFGSYLKSPPKNLAPLLGLASFATSIVIFEFKYSTDLFMVAIGFLLVLKLFEAKAKQDFQTAVCISLFFNFYTLFYFTGFFSTIILTTNTLFLLVVLAAIQQEKRYLKLPIKIVGKIVMLALPLLIILFFLFPRIPVSFWQFKISDRGMVGFTDKFRLDDVKDLALIYEPAFRAEFFAKFPKRQDLYWRGLVYEEFDGVYWSRNKQTKVREAAPEGTESIEYQIILEPHNEKWLFALDWAQSMAQNQVRAKFYTDHTLQANSEIGEEFHYRIKSVYNTNAQISGAPNRWKNLSLPKNYNPQTLALANKISAQFDNPSDIIQAALQNFKTNTFYYSLQPPLLGTNAIDDFLFKTRIGYCEHYASSLAFILRAAGVPARIVGGYLGGEYNQAGNYMIIRQSDAHVWVEAYVNNHWQRIDPTAYVSPARLESAAAAVTNGTVPYLKNKQRFGSLYDLLNQAYLQLDALDFAWTKLVESYDVQTQARILDFFGLDLRNNLVLATFILAVISIIVFIGLFIFRLLLRQRELTPVQNCYLKFLHKCQRLGLEKPPFMSASDFNQQYLQGAKCLTDIQQQLANKIVNQYTALSYQDLSIELSQKNTEDLVKLVQQF